MRSVRGLEITRKKILSFTNLTCFFLSIILATPVVAEVIQPARDNPLRKMLLDMIRPRVETELRTKVQFIVEKMRVEDDCAFLIVTPRKENGRKIDIENTIFRNAGDQMDGLTIYSLLKLRNGHWYEFVNATGPTDVVFETWPERYLCSRGIFQLN